MNSWELKLINLATQYLSDLNQRKKSFDFIHLRLLDCYFEHFWFILFSLTYLYTMGIDRQSKKQSRKNLKRITKERNPMLLFIIFEQKLMEKMYGKNSIKKIQESLKSVAYKKLLKKFDRFCRKGEKSCNIQNTIALQPNCSISQIKNQFKRELAKISKKKFAQSVQSSAYEARQFFIGYPLSYKCKQQLPFILSKQQSLYEQETKSIISSLANEGRGSLILVKQFDRGIIQQAFTEVNRQNIEKLIFKIQNSLLSISTSHLISIQIQGIPVLQTQISNGGEVSYNGFAIRINVSVNRTYPSLFEVKYQVHKTTKALSYLGCVVQKTNSTKLFNYYYYENQRVQIQDETSDMQNQSIYDWMVKLAKHKIKEFKSQKQITNEQRKNFQISISFKKIQNLKFFNYDQKLFLRDSNCFTSLLSILNDTCSQSNLMTSLLDQNQKIQSIEIDPSQGKLKIFGLPLIKNSIININENLHIQYDKTEKNSCEPKLICLALPAQKFDLIINKISEDLEKRNIKFSFIAPIVLQFQKKILDLISDSTNNKIIVVLKVFEISLESITSFLMDTVRNGHFFVSSSLYLRKILTKQQQELYLAFMWDKFVEIPKIKKQIHRNLTMIQFNSQLINVAIYSFTMFSLAGFFPSFIQKVK